jgi:SAM-dependent methyltransferase
MPARLEMLSLPLLRCARGDLPPNVALGQLLMQARHHVEVQDAIARAIEQNSRDTRGQRLQRLLRLRELWNETPDAFATVKGTLLAVDHDHEGSQSPKNPADWAGAFDRAARFSPAASVALYSLGRTDVLNAATDEIVTRMREWSLLAKGNAALDIGCGTGRITSALARHIRLAVGIDVAPAMLSAARRTGAAPANAHFLRTSGYDLAPLRDSTFELVCAVDSFPYLVMSGVAERHVHEAARVLKPGGSLFVGNYSYRGDVDADRADLARVAHRAGLTVRRDGTREFALWDGVSFLLQKKGA